MADRFPSPFEMPTPPGAEGWQDLYAYSSVFSEDRREYEESMFWFMDGVHTPEVIPPWDATILEYAIIALSQYNTRHYVIPPALGVDIRFLNGYMYLSPVGVANPDEIAARVPEFAEQAGYYFQNWDRLYEAWMPKVRALIEELESISFEPLPDREDMAVITEGRGTGSALGLLSTYHRLVDLTLKLWHHHFEFLNLGYAAYLDFFGCCKQLFPSIPDQAIAKMVAGIEVDLFKPDDEVKKLAQLAVELGLQARLDGQADEVLAGLRGDPSGEKWLGTPMGELLRRYWYPVAFTRELDEFPVRPARLLGEDFAVFKTPRGRYGILPEACPHRRASLAYGVVEADGLRCPYHGWLFGTDGTCLEQPAEREETNFRERVRAKAGRVQALGGLVWAYIGPEPVPELPRFDVFVMDGVRDIGWTDLPCNFVQIMENAVDPHHTEWLHGRFFEFMARHQGFDAPPSFGKKHVKVGFDAFEWGIIKRRVVAGASEEDDDWKVGHPLVFPYNMRVGGANIEQMQIRVPVDRTTTRFMLYTVHAPAGIAYPEQPQVPDYQIPVYDEHGRHRVDYVEGQDMMAWVTQGPITDRTVEHLGRSDVGVTMLRRMFKEQMTKVARGEDPLGVVRAPHDRIDLPCEKNKFDAGGSFALDFIDKASSQFSPQADALKKLHIKAHESREAVAS